ncbi:conserved Plasmodium protein, unknown function [Plasmodium malariae]|uniref:Uncharacterized protein n=1 Tax=Plasmodium malariae TaxID=5858 RepID=A0A1D3JN49_PLAMA|nr:conserved Plasmodium protein, unknown function [Plasmodium malariae]SBT88004.1 conserved Plasmodium protein, unknown function [Plasmodium malariae]
MHGDTRKLISDSNVHNNLEQKMSKYNYKDFKTENQIFFNSLSRMNSMYSRILTNSNSFDLFDTLLKRDSSSKYSKCNSILNWKQLSKRISTNKDEHIDRKEEYVSRQENEINKGVSSLRGQDFCPFNFMIASFNNLVILKNNTFDKSFTGYGQSFSSFKNRKLIKCKTFKLDRKKKKKKKKKKFYKNETKKVYDINFKKNVYNQIGKKQKVGLIREKIKSDDEIFFLNSSLKNACNLEHISSSTFYCQVGNTVERQISGETSQLEKISLEKRRVDQNHVEQNRIEQNRIEQNRVEQNRVEQNRVEQNHVEQNRVEQNRVEQNRVEQNRVEQNRIEQIREEYMKYISLSIKRQEEKMECLAKNVDHLLDVIELLLYKRMKEIFLLKEDICSKDRYKEICPDVFYFSDNDDLLETMDRKFRFLPKIPAKENLTPYYGPSSSDIFGKHYFTYKYFYKIIKVDVKLYKLPDPYNNSFNKFYDQNYKYNYSFDLLKYNKMEKPCMNKHNIRKANKMEATKRNGNFPFFISTNALEESKKKKKKKNIGYTNIDKIPEDLIHLLNYKNIIIT